MAEVARAGAEEEAAFRVLEERLAMPTADDTMAVLASLLAPEFLEYGSSGRIFDRATVLEALQQGDRPRVVLENFKANVIARGVILVTYLSRSVPGERWTPPALRSSLWCRLQEHWQLVFHQGTPLPAEQ
ncbi:MAG: nuclear transport factor 2 family protein [Pseudomonadota bacterium]|nr:nuclear transport factor 2 family protein [Pseudomonadota bacterium]